METQDIIASNNETIEVHKVHSGLYLVQRGDFVTLANTARKVMYHRELEIEIPDWMATAIREYRRSRG